MAQGFQGEGNMVWDVVVQEEIHGNAAAIWHDDEQVQITALIGRALCARAE